MNLMNYTVFEKTVENMTKHINLILNCLLSETNYHNTKFFTENYTYAYTYLVGDDSEDKNYKNCLKATQLENEINYSPKKRH